MPLNTFASALALLLLASTSQAQRLTHDFDKGTDFSRFTRYAWVTGHELTDPTDHGQVTAAVEAQLTAKGLRPVAAGEAPDVLVAYHATFERGAQLTGITIGSWPNPGTGWSGMARSQKLLPGTLVVDVIDAATRTTVWRGTARDAIDVEGDAARRGRTIARVVERLFGRYPPPRASSEDGRRRSRHGAPPQATGGEARVD